MHAPESLLLMSKKANKEINKVEPPEKWCTCDGGTNEISPAKRALLDNDTKETESLFFILHMVYVPRQLVLLPPLMFLIKAAAQFRLILLYLCSSPKQRGNEGLESKWLAGSGCRMPDPGREQSHLKAKEEERKTIIKHSLVQY